MSEKSKKKGLGTKTQKTTKVEPVVKKRGRPKGSKNKNKSIPNPTPAAVQVKRRGRPKGSKNKLKEVKPLEIKQPKIKLPRGRPAKKDKAPVQANVPKAPADALEEHPLFVAAKWLEKKMHSSEMQYYRSRAYKNGMSPQYAIVADLIGFFNIQDSELTKQVKKNNFIVSISKSNELHH